MNRKRNRARCNTCTWANIPAQPVRVNLPTWFPLPQGFRAISSEEYAQNLRTTPKGLREKT